MSLILSVSFIALAYLLGSIPIGLLLCRLYGVDIRTVGSGNIGATNVFRSVGKAPGIATFVGDALKGFVPAYVFPILGKLLHGSFQSSEIGLLCGCAAIAGHNWPLFLRFQGGKGIATSAGVLLGIAPAAVGIGLLGWIFLFATSRYVSIASIGASIVVPVVSWTLYFKKEPLLPIVLTILGLIAVWRHKSNIQRLIDGTEHRFRFKGKPETGNSKLGT
jgi:acyl phosphate:glycerol-3-phosphate acyltransferase